MHVFFNVFQDSCALSTPLVRNVLRIKTAMVMRDLTAIDVHTDSVFVQKNLRVVPM